MVRVDNSIVIALGGGAEPTKVAWAVRPFPPLDRGWKEEVLVVERVRGHHRHRCQWGVVAGPLHVLHDVIGLVNFGRATLEHLIPMMGV